MYLQKFSVRVFPSEYDSYSEGQICPSEFVHQSLSVRVCPSESLSAGRQVFAKVFFLQTWLNFYICPCETTTKKKIFVPFEFVENTRTYEKMDYYGAVHKVRQHF